LVQNKELGILLKMKTLQIIQSAYRCTVEEQDDPVIWFVQVVKNAGSDLDILLRGNAVNYTVMGQGASGVTFGEWKQTQPANLEHDLKMALDSGINIYLITEDAQMRGISSTKILSGVKTISRQELPQLFEQYAQIWHW
jgi:predicted peroxiredoxin